MIRRWLTVGALTVPIVVALQASASAGGGCHTGVTKGHGDTVYMRDACFTPTLLYVDPGTTVTWVNEDPMTHNVTANLWGQFDGMSQGDVARATFDDPGIYPYACSFHPGMTGAVVVGDAKGPGNGAAVVIEPWEPPAASAESASIAEPASSTSATNGASPVLPWVGGTLLGFVVAVAGGAVRAASRRVPSSR